MRTIVTGLACLTMLVGYQVSAQQQNDQQDQKQKSQREQQKGQQQKIRGTVAGVTSIGEAVIDPQSNQAVIVEVDYLTVVGSPTGAEASQSRSEQDRQKQKEDRQSGASKNKTAQDSGGRQNVYLVAITAETKIRTDKRSQQAPDQSENSDQRQDRSAFETLEIGDRVEIQFENTKRLQAKTEGSEDGGERTAGFRGGDQKKTHGRDRIFIGDASEIRFMTGRTLQPGQNRDQKEDHSR